MLAKQYAKTGNLLDICNDPEWQQEGARIEDECDGYIEAGVHLRGYVERLQRLKPEQHKQIKQKAKMLSILFPELRQWVESWELGAGFEEAHRLARIILMEKWQIVASDQEEWVTALLTEDQETEKSEEKPIRQQTRAKLAEMFTDEDWQKIADGAAQAVKQNVLQVGQVKTFEPETAEAA